MPDLPADLGDTVVGAARVTRNALARFVSIIAASGFMLVTGVIVARRLGPDAKGIVATATYLATLGAGVFSLGLGPAFIVLSGRATDAGRRGSGSTVVAGLLAAAAGGLVTGGIVMLAGLAWTTDHRHLGAAVGGITALLVLNSVLTGILEARGRLVDASIAITLIASVSAAATGALVLGANGGVIAAVTAQILGVGAGAAYLAVRARRSGPAVRTGFDVAYVRHAIQLGWPIATSEVLRLLARRADVVVVYALAGPGPAGLYSVAVTMGELVLYAPGAVRIVTFPAAAGLDDRDAPGYVAQLTRVGVLTAVIVAVPLAAVVPWLLPRLFGPGFTAAVVPAVVLVLGATAAAGQAALSYALAARRQSRVLLSSYATTFVAMVGLDLALVPTFGIRGAAVAYVVASLLGAGVAARSARLTLAGGRLALLPGPGDVHDVLASLRSLRPSPAMRNRP